MALNELDALLNQFRTRTEFANQNLIEFCDLLIYRQLSGEGGMPKTEFHGVTRARVDGALALIDRMWIELAVLNSAIETAGAFRKSIWIFTDGSAREFEQLLRGQTIELPAISTPLSTRNLLGPGETAQRISIDALQARMTQEFEVAKAVILAVQKAWDDLSPAIAAASDDALALHELAAKLRAPGMDELENVRHRIADLRAQINADPLQVNSTLADEIQPQLQRVRSHLGERIRERRQMEDALARATIMLQELEHLREKTAKAFDETTAKIANPNGLTPCFSEAKLLDVRTWLQTLQAKAQFDVKPVRIALDKWERTVASAVEDERKALAANEAPLNIRADLRGRLDAFKAKAQAHAARGIALAPGLHKLGEDAHQALHQRPTHLDISAKLVRAYERALTESIQQKAGQA